MAERGHPNNPVFTQLKGRNIANDETIDAVSVVLDANGDPVLRVVDAAPFAYNPTEDATKVALKRRIVLYNTPQGGVVAASGALDTTISPPAGKMWQLKQLTLGISAPSGATTGTHRIQCFIGAAKEMAVLSFIAGSAESINIRRGLVVSPTSNAEPPTAQLMSVISQLAWTPDAPFIFRYQNDTNASQGVQRAILMLIEETPLV
jgi:hypothetical protein